MSIPPEDCYEDILGKAQRGLGLSEATLCSCAGISPGAWQEALQGFFVEATARAVAPLLGLDAQTLVECGQGVQAPPVINLDGLRQYNTPFGDMHVNAYLLWHPQTREAVIFDSGADASDIIAEAQRENLRVRHILLTHAHPDHIADLKRLRHHFAEASVAIHRNEAMDGVESFDEGMQWQLDGLGIVARHTPGHSAGGTSFVVSGLAQPVAVVGDALFAGSMGGAASAWQQALEGNRTKILSLAPDTILCPGHGPLTTVAWEKQHNPFYSQQ